MTALHHRLENLRILDRDAGDVLTRLLARVVERPAGTLLYTEGCPVESTRILLQAGRFATARPRMVSAKC